MADWFGRAWWLPAAGVIGVLLLVVLLAACVICKALMG